MISGSELQQRLKNIRCLLLDVDGVLTDGKLYFDSTGGELKAFDAQDGHGIALAVRVGLTVGFISGRLSPVTTRRAAELGVHIVMQQPANKMDLVDEVKQRQHLTNEQICFVGDELVDVPVLRRAGVAIAVPNAVIEAKQHAHYVTHQPGGHGAVREVIELILKAQGLWPKAIEKYMV